ncbi:helix-turn-helix transcriptional regulator [Myroides odoratimimus]|uniref:helix-turn-helix domain-containing protein n=1 Tax=Myroides odoratimimus TaxID=76832 RepID=UPI0026E03971|nr:helix-turn-helix transcriptional regulator [Myroides odoratimimus]MDO5858989.1 helix-turn-helix transcriptional regulator [Myroides odoratimimus]
MNLGKAIRSIRKERKLTQADVASKAGLSITALSQIEKGESQPQKNTLESICSVLGVTKNHIFFMALDVEDISDERKVAFNVLYEPLRKLILEDIKTTY